MAVNEVRNKKKLKTDLLTVETLLIVGLCAVLGLVGYFTIRTMLYQRYEFYITDMLEYVSSMLDTDDLAECMRTGVKSEKFAEEQAFLDNFKDHHSIAYIYVIKPLNDSDNDNIMNVIAAMSTYEKEFVPENEVGLNELTGNSYPPDVARLYLDASKKVGEITFFENDTEEWGDTYTGILPLVTSSGEYLAVLCVDILINDIGQTLSNYTTAVIALIVLLGTIYVTGNMMWLGRRVVAPVKKLGECMRTFADSGNSHLAETDLVIIDPEIRTGDEMQMLSEQTVDLMQKIKIHVGRIRSITAEKERIGAELDIAVKMQSDMLPKDFPKRSDIELYATMTPAREMGGDFYDFFMIDDDHLGLVMADVSGNGIPAAMFMIVAKTLIKIRTTAPGTPAQMLFDVNNTLCADNPSDLFVTAWFGILTLSTGELISANAGHEYPALMHDGGDYELLTSENMPPLASVENIEYFDETMTLQKGDRLFLYTDGVPEGKNPLGERFGTEKMLRILNHRHNVSPEELLNDMMRKVNEFAGESDQFDDVTMMSVVWKGSK